MVQIGMETLWQRTGLSRDGEVMHGIAVALYRSS